MERLPVTNPQAIINGLKNERIILWNLYRLYDDMQNADMIRKIEDRLNVIENTLEAIKYITKYTIN